MGNVFVCISNAENYYVHTQKLCPPLTEYEGSGEVSKRKNKKVKLEMR